MTCYHPIKAWRSKTIGSSGKRSIVFNINQGFSDLAIQVPCGQCIGCRLEKSRQWAIRCSHEASLYNNNSFITLTYNDANLPPDGSLNLRHFQLFMKKLRKKYGNNIRYFHCGEYGEKLQRPHYHACLFNHDFNDKIIYKYSNKLPLYNSKELDDLWGLGFAVIGEVTFQSAAYVARYQLKKINGPDAEKHYAGRKPEYVTMSRRPGIGQGWLDRWTSDVYPSDQVVINGRPMRPPKYYDRQYELTDPKTFRNIRGARVVRAKTHADDNTPERLSDREKVQQAQAKQLPRNIEDGNNDP